MKKPHQTSISDNKPIQFPKIRNSLSAELYLKENGTLVIPFINHHLKAMASLDLRELHPNVREYLIRWLIEVNRRRLENGEQMLITYSIIKQCPIWKSIKMPYKLLKLDKVILAKRLADQQAAKKSNQ